MALKWTKLTNFAAGYEAVEMGVTPAAAPTIETPAPLPEPVSAEPGDPNVFDLLAEQARSRTGRQLGFVAVAGAVNAAFFWRFPHLWWVASGCITACSYGVWGLADHGLDAMEDYTPRSETIIGLLEIARALALVVGSVTAVAALYGFMGAGLGGWIH